MWGLPIGAHLLQMRRKTCCHSMFATTRWQVGNTNLPVLGSPPVTPVKVDRLEQLLTGYSPALKSFLADGFRFGFSIHFVGERSSFESPNLKSALQSPDIVSAKLQKEIDAGRIVGPFRTHPFPVFRTLPISLDPKKTPNEFRLIHHLSYPKGLSVNDSIPDDCSSVHYATISDAVNILKNLGRVAIWPKPISSLPFE